MTDRQHRQLLRALHVVVLRRGAEREVEGKDVNRFLALHHDNPVVDEYSGLKFRDLLISCVLHELEDVADLDSVRGLWQWIELLLENWETVLKIILFVISLF